MFRIDYPFKKEILACGAQEKASFCLTKKNCAYVVNELGTLADGSVFEDYQRKIEEAKKELKVKPKVIIHDLHPDYPSTKYAQELSQKNKGLKCVAIQHHHAHIASCIAENGIKEKVIGVVFDAGALGEDGQIWGGDFFVGSLKGFKRVAHFCGLSAAGLFDRVALLAGLREKIEYEGQGVNDLGRIVNRSSHVVNKTYEFTLKQNKDELLIHPEPIFEGVTNDLKSKISKSIISAVFHNAVLEITREVCRKIKQKEKVSNVILTGSVFQNKVLLNGVKEILTEDGFNLITHRHFSCNDSHISFGQAVLANTR